jgi:hypothetical protein
MFIRAGLMASLFVMPTLGAASAEEWRFRVFLDDKEIGYHEFRLQRMEDELQLSSKASFEYRLLFVKLYEYLHKTTETWRGNCLTGIESRTDANGKPYRVQGVLIDDRFVVEGAKGRAEVPGCLMSFAYWNPDFLQQNQLLNAQNGEVLEVRVSEPEPVELEVHGDTRPAFRYRLEAGELDIHLWYSENREWLALETEARGGRVLRYELL